MPRFQIGIDLGTTNSAVAYLDTSRKSVGQPQPFAIAQLIAAGEVKPRLLLPSFLYLPAGPELPAKATVLPWHGGSSAVNYVVGEFARLQGAKVPPRLIASAKSWLCHPGVDRTAALLPWGAPPEVERHSPLEVSTRYLRHMAEAWDHAHQDAPIREQDVTLTVPASFDDVARELTMKAAQAAGLKSVTLLEEPQAAFYCWLATAPHELLRPGMSALVVDVGGGTSDFSIIGVGESQGELTFVREAVGDHLLLGGDNMDLALAKHLESRFKTKVDQGQLTGLVQACRQAKEVLLGPNPPASYPVTVVGRGRSVVGNTVTTQLTADDVRQVLFEGFFPETPFSSDPARPSRGGLQEMGLPYVADAAITRHLALFLRRQLGDRKPDAILFNGGVFTPQTLRDRLVHVMRGWYGSDWQPILLTTPSLDLAVALGAAHAGWLRASGGRRIGGGSARSYYLGISDESGPAVLCVVPRRQEEGHEITLSQPALELAIGEPVSFPLFASTVRADDKPGQILHVQPDQLRTLPPLQTVLKGGKRAGVKTVPVTLAAKCTEIGTLELACVAKDGGNRWKLEFGVRDSNDEDEAETSESTGPTEVFPEELVRAAGEQILTCFRSAAVAPQELPKAIEAATGLSRSQWPTGLCRQLWKYVLEVAEERGRSPQHLSRWYYLAGYFLRPGFGEAGDKVRIEQLWKALNQPYRVEASGVRLIEGGSEYWVMWRRVSGGLVTTLQQQLYQRLKTALIGKGGSKPAANELAEMWRAAGSFERLDPKAKTQLGETLLKQINRGPIPNYAFWTLARLGARSLVYGAMNSIVHRETVEGWLAELLKCEPNNETESQGLTFAVANLTRMTGQRALDVEDEIRSAVVGFLEKHGASADLLAMVKDVVATSTESRTQILGDSLPVGLRLARD